MPAHITKTNPVNGRVRTMRFDLLEQDDFERRYLMYRRGEITIEEAFPMLSRNAREFVKNGITSEEWEKELENKT
jgi:hypothetical protein